MVACDKEERVGDIPYTKMCGFCIRCVILCELYKDGEYNRSCVILLRLNLNNVMVVALQA